MIDHNDSTAAAEGAKMIRIIAAMAAAIAPFLLGGAVGAPGAQAEPRCLFQGDWNCEGMPPYHGPMLPTWDVPGTYGGWTTNPIQCDVVTRQCHQVTTQP